MIGLRRPGRRLAPVGLVAAALWTSPPGAHAQTVSGQLQPRFEARRFDDRTEAFTSMRTRLGVDRAFSWPGRLFVQIQDVRIWGSEPSTTTALPAALDLHQAFVEIGSRGDSPLWLRVGRQELAYGTERLIGAPDWAQRSRSFDGVRGTLRVAEGVGLDLFATQLAESAAGGAGDALFAGAWAEARGAGGRRLAGYLLVEDDGRASARDRRTLGVEAVAPLGPVEGVVEAAVQDTDGVGERASMLAFRLTTALGGSGLRVTGGVDRMSGRAPGEDRRPFSRLFGRAHRFYGYADLFRDLDADTGGRGLVDWLARARWPTGRGITLQLDLHRFEVVEGAGLGDGRLADEVDLLARWSGPDGLSLLGGVSWVDGKEALSAIGRPGLGQWFGYLQLGVVF